MPQLTHDERTARHIRAIYNYNVGQPRSLGRFILILLLLSPLVGLALGVMAAVRHALGL